MRLALAAAGILCASAVAGAQAGHEPGRVALAAIDACIPKLDPALDVGFERVSARCPALSPALERSGWAAWLPAGWKEARNDLSAGSLAELRTLVARELAAPAPDGPRPSVARLNEVLIGLGPRAQQSASLWARFRAWLRAVVERNHKVDDASWLDRMIQRSGRSQVVIDLVTYGSLVLVLTLAGVILVNELRAAGFIRSRSREHAARQAAEAAAPTRLSWADVDGAAFTDKPRLLLELVVSRLTDARKLPPAGAMTVQELTSAVKLEEPADRERLSEIARAAERARFSDASLAPRTVDSALEQGRALLERLGKPA